MPTISVNMIIVVIAEDVTIACILTEKVIGRDRFRIGFLKTYALLTQ